MSVLRVGCVGLGNMGGHLAANIARAGFDVAVFDVRPDAAERFQSLGARIATSPKDVAAEVDVLTVTVLNDAQVDDVLFGQQGALQSLKPGATIVIHSTVSPESCRAAAHRAGGDGVLVIDAPLSGGEGAAREGALTLMIGGSPDAVAACAPVLEAVSARRFHVGDVGSGQVAKLVNNLMGIVNRLVIAESLELAREAGLQDDVVLDVVRSSTGNSWQVEHWPDMQAIAAASTTGPEGMALMAKKDLGLALQLAEALKVDIPIVRTAHDHTADMFSDKG
jgi:3-hydroxyisobutyrate dehydrogenase-like beta-hydroxyacid dehydrogenase